MTLRQDALIASYRRLERSLYNVLYRQLWQAQDCQDLIHDAYMRIWARRSKVDEGTLDALVWRTALNLSKNRLRWRRLRLHDTLEETSPMLTMPEATVDFLAERQLHQALRHLPQQWQQVLLLSHFSDMSGAQIASVLGIPAGTVASRKHQAMARLKTLMATTRHA